MSAKDNGGPAFPARETILDPENPHDVAANYPGMTLRDYFAAQQMCRIASGWPNAENMQRIAADCYAMAGAMLAERNK